MKYKFRYKAGNDRFVPIEVEVPFKGVKGPLEVRLPAWRPGRYELGYFAKNVRHFKVVDAAGIPLISEKTGHSAWEVSEVDSDIIISYEYYAGVLNGGSCWWDHDQLYINPIQCAVYIPGREDEKCTVELNIPNNWEVATGMKKLDDSTWQVTGFHELADSPFIASPSLQHGKFEMDGIDFHIWFQGICDPDMEKIISDVKDYTRVQLDTMGSFPVDEFHYLTQITPNKFYHGVEHMRSTVLALGPGADLMKPELYTDLIGVASHELFHVWNVKTIRPSEMLPYNYDAENYSPSGLVYEGVTTYYGDLFLARSGFFDLNGYLNELNMRLQKHMDNEGRLNYSVLESSFDTWLDGYVPGIPGRKTSIYDEGCLLALCADFLIRIHTDSEKTLDDVMRKLYNAYGKINIGYSFSDYKQLVCEAAGSELDDFFSNVVTKAVSYDTILKELLHFAGLTISISPSNKSSEKFLGIRSVKSGDKFIVFRNCTGSPGALAGILSGDELVKINGLSVSEFDVSHIERNTARIEVELVSNHMPRKVNVVMDDGGYWQTFKIVPLDEINGNQLNFRKKWINI